MSSHALSSLAENLMYCIQKCRDQFCPSHRFPSDHNCPTRPVPPARPGLSHLFNNINVNTKNVNAKVAATATATLGAVKKSATSASVPKFALTVPKQQGQQPTPSSSHANPFSKTDRWVRFFSCSPVPTHKSPVPLLCFPLSLLTTIHHRLTANVMSTMYPPFHLFSTPTHLYHDPFSYPPDIT